MDFEMLLDFDFVICNLNALSFFVLFVDFFIFILYCTVAFTIFLNCDFSCFQFFEKILGSVKMQSKREFSSFIADIVEVFGNWKWNLRCYWILIFFLRSIYWMILFLNDSKILSAQRKWKVKENKFRC